MHTLYDAVEIIGAPRRTENGYMVVDSAVARIGVQEYYAAELGDEFKDLPANQIVRLDRPASVVFGDDSMRSYAHKPITNNHPPVAVTAENWAEYGKGHVGDEVRQEGRFIRVPMMVSDGETIRDIESGKREWSAGYGVTFERVTGVNDSGETYDARITSQKINHIALVDKGRAGSDCRIGDNKRQPTPHKGAAPMAEVKMTDAGIPFTVADATAEAVVNKIIEARDKAVSALDTATAKHDAEAAVKDAEIARLTGMIVDEATIDKLAAEKAEVLADAKSIHDTDYSGKTAAEIRRIAVVAKIGDSMTGKSDDYIAARFDTLKDTDQIADSVREKGTGTVVVDAAKAHADYMNRFTQNKAN